MKLTKEMPGMPNKKSTAHLTFPGKLITYVTIDFKLVLTSESALTSFDGSKIRDILEKGTIALYCIRNKLVCGECNIAATCPYPNLFKHEPNLNHFLVTVPFVVFIEDNRELLNPGDSLSFHVTLFGEFMAFKDQFLKVLKYAGEIGLGQAGSSFEMKEIREGKKKCLAAIDSKTARSLKLKFGSQGGLDKEQKPLDTPRIEDIIEYIAHKVNRLDQPIWRMEGDTLDRQLFKGCRVIVSKYRSDNIDNKDPENENGGHIVKLSGFRGHIESSGDKVSLYPQLRAGEILQIGSRSSYGSGKYELIAL
jgi:hypothetical protein